MLSHWTRQDPEQRRGVADKVRTRAKPLGCVETNV